MDFEKITEQSSKYKNLEQKSFTELLEIINQEDQTVPFAVQKCLPQIQLLLEALLPKMQQGGRLFYVGAGTSGRLGVLDASECPPTFGVPHNWVIGLIAGGDEAIRKAVENAEDDPDAAWIQLQNHQINTKDFLIGIAASGTTPYVVGALQKAKKMGISTGAICCNAGSPLDKLANYPIACVVGPEVITGSSRMKAGTAQKLILNLITTTVMIKLGRVKDNKMVDMHFTNHKLQQRAIKMVMDAVNCDTVRAKELIDLHGSVRLAIENA